MTANSIVLQASPCSFYFHFEEIIGALYFGGTLVMLPSNGNRDAQYICACIENQQVTVAFFVPLSMKSLYGYVQDSSNNYQPALQSIRRLCSVGM
ncbi:unnamed protein product [Rotaria socialis]|nr:unnamed protein product [Rotaria socialis]